MAPLLTAMGDTSKSALDGHPRYRKVKDLGSGTFGSVVLCDDLRNPPSQVAVKLIPRGPSSVTEYVVSEIRNFRFAPLSAYFGSLRPACIACCNGSSYGSASRARRSSSVCDLTVLTMDAEMVHDSDKTIAV